MHPAGNESTGGVPPEGSKSTGEVQPYASAAKKEEERPDALKRDAGEGQSGHNGGGATNSMGNAREHLPVQQHETEVARSEYVLLVRDGRYTRHERIAMISGQDSVQAVSASTYKLAETVGAVCGKIMKYGKVDNYTLAMIGKICLVVERIRGTVNAEMGAKLGENIINHGELWQEALAYASNNAESVRKLMSGVCMTKSPHHRPKIRLGEFVQDPNLRKRFSFLFTTRTFQ